MNEKNTIPPLIKNIMDESVQNYWNFIGAVKGELSTSIDDWIFIAESGTFNRTFRRWEQTTWLDKNWCDSFNGMTPRQYVKQNADEISQWRDMHWGISCYIDDDYLFEEKKVALSKYVFGYSINRPFENMLYLPIMAEFGSVEKFFAKSKKGVSISSTGKLNNIYKNRWYDFLCQDRDFLPWIVQMLWNKGLLEFIPSSLPKKGKAVLTPRGKAYFSLEPEDQFPTLFKYFILSAVSAVIDAIDRQIFLGREKAAFTPKNKDVVSNKLLNMITEAAMSSRWIDVDIFLGKFWDILYELFPDRLLNNETILDMEESRSSRKYWNDKEPLKTIVSEYAFYDLALAFDKYLLFPLDRYFGLVECVWTEQKQMLRDLSTYLSYAKKLSPKYYFYSEDRKNFEDFCDCLFAPCTSFRFVFKTPCDF